MQKAKFIILVILLISSPLTWGAALQPLTLILDWFTNPDHAPLFVAEQQGFFKQQGLDVTLIAPADPSDPPKLVAAGKADLAITYQPQLVLQTESGLPLMRVATLIDQPLNCLVVNKNTTVQNVKDLKGKKIGYSLGGTELTMLKALLASQGLTLADVQLINVRYDLTQALLSKRVDAVIGMMRNFEPLEMELAGQPARIFPVENYGIPRYHELIIVANQKDRSDPRIKKFIIALTEGETYLQQHPKECWESFAKAHPELNNELNQKAWFATLPFFAKNPGSIDSNQEKIVNQFFHQQIA